MGHFFVKEDQHGIFLSEVKVFGFVENALQGFAVERDPFDEFGSAPQVVFLLRIDIAHFSRILKIEVRCPEVGIFFKRGLSEEEHIGVFGFLEIGKPFVARDEFGGFVHTVNAISIVAHCFGFEIETR